MVVNGDGKPHLHGIESLTADGVVYLTSESTHADALIHVGMIAVGIPSTMDTWADVFTESLHARNVGLVVDATERSHARLDNAAQKLHDHTHAIKPLILPLRRTGVGFESWVHDHAGAPDAMARLWESAPPWCPAGTTAIQAREIPVFRDIRDRLTDNGRADQPRWVVDGLLEAGSTSLLVGPPFAGKSALIEELAVAVARGNPFLGRETIQGRVLLVQLEGTGATFDERLGVLGGQDTGGNLLVLHGTDPRHNVAWLERETRLYRPVLVIVDTLQKFEKIPDIIDYAQVTQVLNPYVALAQQAGTINLMTHHTNRDGGMSARAVLGSTALAAVVDTLIIVDRRADGSRIIATEQRSGENLTPRLLEMDHGSRHLRIGAPAGLGSDDLDSQVVALLTRSNKPITEKQIREGVDKSSTAVIKAVGRLIAQNRVQKAGKGVSGDPYTYCLAPNIVAPDPEPTGGNRAPQPLMKASVTGKSQVSLPGTDRCRAPIDKSSSATSSQARCAGL